MKTKTFDFVSIVHIGEKIKEIVEDSHHSVVEFADLIGLSRDGAYKIFTKDYIDTSQLRKIGQVLNYDFFKYLSDAYLLVEEPEGTFGYATKDDVFSVKGDVAKVLTIVQNLDQKIEGIQTEMTAIKKSIKKT